MSTACNLRDVVAGLPDPWSPRVSDQYPRSSEEQVG